MNKLDTEYKNWLVQLKSTIRSVQAKAAVAVNSALIGFYWELGKMIAEKETGYGTGFLEQVSKDLKDEFPEMKGLSVRNLKYARQFYHFYATISNLQQAVAQLESTEKQIVVLLQQPVDQIPWGHNILIFSKSKSVAEARFYITETIENGWSRDVLALQLKSQLYQRQGKAITNFKNTLPEPLSDLAQQTLKDDKPTIGILLCRDKNTIETEFALRDINKPMGVSEFQLTEILPDDLKSSLPSIEEIENEFKKVK